MYHLILLGGHGDLFSDNEEDNENAYKFRQGDGLSLGRSVIGSFGLRTLSFVLIFVRGKGNRHRDDPHLRSTHNHESAHNHQQAHVQQHGLTKVFALEYFSNSNKEV
jgi:hypothetical protein